LTRFFLIFFVSTSVYCTEYVLLSIPKAGTHLGINLFKELTGEEPYFYFPANVGNTYDAVKFPPHSTEIPSHFASLLTETPHLPLNMHFNLAYLLAYDPLPHRIHFVMLRDLRDVAVSTVFYCDHLIKEQMGEQASFEDKLAYVIHGMGPIFHRSVYNLSMEAKAAFQWMQKPGVIVIRFEDLVGQNGGGNDAAQTACILNVASALGMELTLEELDRIKEKIWGGTLTFRKGQIGAWKSHFSKKNIRLFKRLLGQDLIQLGYEKDFNW
jgi:hypothetical protein